ncbi:MAG TPA: Asp-tRNA(Asn)/Glu-tRNA(Gln) amidotransferase subunit GatC [bacterium]|nr:Asp-tRNA(Asn)/Glu-tRNA(Gln) amidotransferase subunit GatC [bacterium]
MGIDRRTVEHVARLARLELTAEEIERFARQLAAILDHFAALQQLDTSGVEPTALAVEQPQAVREDVPRPGLPRDEVLAGAPASEHGFFKVPSVIEAEDVP